MSHHGVMISVWPNGRQTPDLLLEQKLFKFHTARIKIFQSKGLSGLASLGECPHPRYDSKYCNIRFSYYEQCKFPRVYNSRGFHHQTDSNSNYHYLNLWLGKRIFKWIRGVHGWDVFRVFKLMLARWWY